MDHEKTQRILRISLLVLMLAFLAAIALTLREKVVVVGDSAPDFSITTDSGRSISAANFGGKVLVLNFWATWCPPCVSEFPSLSRFAANLAGSGVVVLAISVDKDAKVYKAFLDRNKPVFLTARDPEAKINADFGTFKYPETYVIDSQGKVLRKYISDQPWDDERMIKDIRSLL
jgi:cytochrome c biogenesis protein CcmG, thiol:disulfide interchange protein DsbE